MAWQMSFSQDQSIILIRSQNKSQKQEKKSGKPKSEKKVKYPRVPQVVVIIRIQ